MKSTPNIKIPSSLAHLLFGAALVGSLTLPGASAFAGTGGRMQHQTFTHIHTQTAYLNANTSYTIETTNLSSGADTVLHVQDASTGAYIAGNDDVSPGVVRSRVTIASSPSSRTVKVVVRAYSALSGGTANVVITPSTGSAQTTAISFTYGFAKSFTSFANASHFFTIEEQGGTWDTVLLVISGTRDHAIAFDDDNGMGLMSWVHVFEACSSGCTVFVGTYSSTSGTGTFMWDEDIHLAACDADGMSDALENAIGTSPCNPDTDADGINDGEETMGVDGDTTKQPLLRFPYFGADPLRKDVFVEADWLQCVPASGTDWTCGNPASPDADTWRMPGSVAQEVAAQFAPDVVVHIDNGVTNTNPATWFTWGAWGGATRQTAAFTGDKCQYLSPSRAGYFHGFRLQGWSGGQASQPGACGDAGGLNSQSFSHELGHNFNLSHGGLQSGSDVNCKPNYRSIMNYAVIYATATERFSRNENAALILNPVSMNEQVGYGTTDPARLAILGFSAFNFPYNPTTGQVDWNRDGLYSPTSIRAAATWGWGGGGGCDVGFYGLAAGNVSENVTQPAMAWLPGDVAGQQALYLFNRRSDGTLQYRSASTFASGASWSPAIGSLGSTISGLPTGAGSPAVAKYVDTLGRNRLMLAAIGGGSLYTATRSAGPAGTWTAPVNITATSGDLSMVNLGNKLYLFAATPAGLREWVFDPTTNSFVSNAGALAMWSDGTPVQAAYGIGATLGYIETSPAGGEIFAAIPAIAPLGVIDLARRDASTGRWVNLGTTPGVWTTANPIVRAQPGLAYVPWSSATPSAGRFYLAWNPGGGNALLITESQGNNLAAAGSGLRGLSFVEYGTYILNVWQTGDGSVALEYDPTFDTNLRGAWTYGGLHQSMFAPVMDNIFDMSLKDQDDFSVIRANLNCALHGGACL